MKKILSLFLIVILCFSTAVITTAQTQSALGDVNGDGAITPGDALLILKHTVEKEVLTGPGLAAADTTGKKDPAAEDALNILQKVVGKIRHFPAEIKTVDYNQWETTKIELNPNGALPTIPQNQNYMKTRIANEPPMVVLCESKEELVAFAEQYSSSPQKKEQAVYRYTDEYFAENCLLLVTVETPSTGTEVLLEGLYAVEDQIYLDLAYWGIHNGGLAVEERTYWIELTGKELSAVGANIETDWYTFDIYGFSTVIKTAKETAPVS